MKFEKWKMENGINFKAVDFVNIGSMVLHNGYWNDEQIIDTNWLKTSTLCDIDNSEYVGTFLADKNIGYQYMWYCTPSLQSGYNIIAWGKSDQVLFISPTINLVILRTGKSDGGISNWVETLQQISNDIKML